VTGEYLYAILLARPADGVARWAHSAQVPGSWGGHPRVTVLGDQESVQ